MTQKDRSKLLSEGFRQKLREMERNTDADFAEKQAAVMLRLTPSPPPTMQVDPTQVRSDPSGLQPVFLTPG